MAPTSLAVATTSLPLRLLIALVFPVFPSPALSATVCSAGEIAVGYQNHCIYGHCDGPVGQLWDSQCGYVAAATTADYESNDYCFVDWDGGASVDCVDTGSEYLPVNVSDGRGGRYGSCRDVDLAEVCGYDGTAEPYNATQINFCCCPEG